MDPELERVMSELIQLGEMPQEVLGLLAENERLQKRLQTELAEAKAAQTRIFRNIAKKPSFADWYTAATCATIQGRVLTDPGMDPTQVSVGLYQPSEFLVRAVHPKEDGTFHLFFNKRGRARLVVIGPPGVVLGQAPVTLIPGTTSPVVIDLRTCEAATCRDWPTPVLSTPISPTVPGKPELVPTRDVRVYYHGSRLVQASRRCAMRALQTGQGLSEYWLGARFETKEGRPLTTHDIDWTGFGLEPIIKVHRVLVKRWDAIGSWEHIGPLERGHVLAEFRRNGVLPEGYRFDFGYPNLHPNDVNWKCA